LVPDDAIEGELVTDEENRAIDRRIRIERWRRVVPATATRTVRVVRVIRDPQTRSGRTSRAIVRHGLTITQGFASWAKRAWDAGTMGVYRRQIKTAEAAGNQEMLAEWTDRKEQAAERRHRRLMDLPTLALGVVKAVFGALVGLFALVLVIALLVQLSEHGTFGGVLAGVLTAIGWLFTVIAFVWTPFLVGAPLLMVLAAWREGTRRGAAPAWLLAGKSTEEGGVLLTADGIVRALQHLNIAALNKAFKDGWIPSFDLVPTREGSGAFKGYRAIFELPLGAAPSMIADRIDVFAANLNRTPVEVWPADHGREKGGKARHVNLYVADSGVMDKPTPPYPLMNEGNADVFAGVPVGITQRGDVVPFPIVGSNFVFGGQPGQGKSNAGRVVMAGSALDPLAEMRVHVFAGNGDFDAYQDRLSRYEKGATPEHAASATEHLRELFEEVGRREERLAELGAKKLTRQIAQQHRDMRPIVVMFSEGHELFGDKDCGKEAAELAVRVVKRGRKTGVTMGFDTQSSRADAIPSQLVENVGVNVARR
jgi:S-DNA-T family DNA segregation ATPase FtsK/SpoIIIE